MIPERLLILFTFFTAGFLRQPGAVRDINSLLDYNSAPFCTDIKKPGFRTIFCGTGRIVTSLDEIIRIRAITRHCAFGMAVT
jgi:hypothetical protein